MGTTQKSTTLAIAETHLQQEKIQKQLWISKEIVQLIEERRRIAAMGMDNQRIKNEFRRISAMIQIKCKQDTNDYLNNIYTEIQPPANNLQTKDIFQK